ncbi:Kunitz/Bovine pancreatic trypsin inhibitor domain protein [Opisthorchis viverrini]|uniref:Kunitz/Bovine pancreatic trypsin inhibitor domain protein n=1 Tax=Opisthorchis viverrini TaxID=6198 RepID=A0A1S8X6K5_OPIVI|nr:Kunitz/Bovine pancreatic trypsin inhibitor domain protein [Opisthorchis viverrini]
MAGGNALQAVKSTQPNSDAFEKLMAWKKNKAVPNYCGYHADPGPCNFPVRRFYYDKDLGECKEFTYSGCLGNLNNFESKASCKMVCIE